MPAPLVTVTRQYASGGSEIARLVARELGWTLIDNEFVDEVARRAGIPAEQVAQQEERAPGLLERVARTLAVASPEMFLASGAGGGVPRVEADEATIVKMTERVIAEAAALGRAVRLTMMNVGHTYVGVSDMDTIGSPLKYSLCCAENEVASPWEPYHVARGFARDAKQWTQMVIMFGLLMMAFRSVCTIVSPLSIFRIGLPALGCVIG